MCGHGVDGKLQALVGVFLRSSLTGLVVDDVHAAVGGAIDPVDSPGNFRAGDLHVEPFFRVQNLRCEEQSGCRRENPATASSPCFRYKFPLIVVLNSGRSQVVTK